MGDETHNYAEKVIKIISVASLAVSTVHYFL